MRFKSIACAIPAFALILAVAVSLGSPTEVRADDSVAKQTRTVLVTGANRGLGLEFARQYQEAGWQVIGTARDPDEAQELEALGVRVMQLDVASQQSVDELAAALGDEPIDLLINNAGIFPRVGKLDEIDFDDYNRTLAVNTVGPVRVTRALLPNLRAGKLKIVAGLSSNLGSIAENERGNFYGYRESKAALNMFTKTLAAELGPEGFTCIVLTPGWVQTDMGGPNANLTPAESIAGMKAVLDRLTPADNGTFWSYNGSQMPW
jgi:NAD(P)-dependent dehydrogenase (short-subunit alcohol dehydrogenase family)